ncbi:hypothetical protein ES332_A13G098600v1 [Gossypium tomentosum]|uniref:Endonuclease/exonuclease/phosphatase domain-containing protein n=1 Tax=Gossypium tomentosum TaxID=34277 RepID=A0A5D2MJC2_GOSTO|nr:hypothetical protein ES332_A13G098600v1 [Gossypium tomentosum]
MNGASWRLSCFYGYSKHTHRRDSWHLLRELVGSNNESWLVMGDFNDIESNSEKEGGDVYHYLIESFKRALANCDLKDAAWYKQIFTWERECGAKHWVYEK